MSLTLNELDIPAQRLLIAALQAQIQAWQTACKKHGINEADAADIQNDIGYAITVLSVLEEHFLKNSVSTRNEH